MALAQTLPKSFSMLKTVVSLNITEELSVVVSLASTAMAKHISMVETSVVRSMVATLTHQVQQLSAVALSLAATIMVVRQQSLVEHSLVAALASAVMSIGMARVVIPQSQEVHSAQVARGLSIMVVISISVVMVMPMTISIMVQVVESTLSLS